MKNTLYKILPVLVAAMSLSACSVSGNTSYLIQVPPIINNSYSGTKRLTVADTVARREGLYGDEEYDAFKNKMKDFAYQMSEYFINNNYQSDANFAFSPYSIELCLGLAIRCSNGNTRKEMLDSLGVDYETFNKYYPYFFSDSSFTTKNSYDDSVVSVSYPTNSIWLDDNLSVKKDCLDDLKNNYYCDAFRVDFGKGNKAANEAIGKFANDKTNGLINPSFDFDPLTLFVLMNTIYMRGVWNEYGNQLNDAPETYKFKNSSGLTSNKPLMMGNYHSGRVINTDDYSCFYTATVDLFNMTFIKPNDGKSIKDVFTKENIDYVTGNHYVYQDNEKLERYHTNCIFPAFEAGASELDLKKPFIEQYNVKTLFSNACDFSNITNEFAYVSDFKQDAKIKVDKTGIEGAAVTYMAVPGSAGPDEYKDVYETFVLDKEFGFVVTSCDNILFSGVVTNID